MAVGKIGEREMVKSGEVCAKCGAEYNNVYDSRVKFGCRHRRKECIKCGYRWTTVEVCEAWTNLGIAKEFDLLPVNYQVIINKLVKDFYELHKSVEDIKNEISNDNSINGGIVNDSVLDEAID